MFKIVGSAFSSCGIEKKWIVESYVTIAIEVISGYRVDSKHDLMEERVWCKNPLSYAWREVSMAKTKLGLFYR